MLSVIINPMSLLVSLTAILGVFSHDTRIDSALITAITPPVNVIKHEFTLDKLLSSNQHIHVETNTSASRLPHFNSLQPATQPRDKDDKKYIAQRRLMGNTIGSEYSWPSI